MRRFRHSSSVSLLFRTPHPLLVPSSSSASVSPLTPTAAQAATSLRARRKHSTSTSPTLCRPALPPHASLSAFNIYHQRPQHRAQHDAHPLSQMHAYLQNLTALFLRPSLRSQQTFLSIFQPYRHPLHNRVAQRTLLFEHTTLVRAASLSSSDCFDLPISAEFATEIGNNLLGERDKASSAHEGVGRTSRTRWRTRGRGRGHRSRTQVCRINSRSKCSSFMDDIYKVDNCTPQTSLSRVRRMGKWLTNALAFARKFFDATRREARWSNSTNSRRSMRWTRPYSDAP